MDTRKVRFGDRERGSTQYDRAEDETAAIVKKTRYLWRVAFRDGGEHLALLARDTDRWEFVGGCDCKGWFYDGRQTGKPCAHLWAIKRAVETIDSVTIDEADDALERGGECAMCGQINPDYADSIEVPSHL